jgi:RimJ/RimL family protein N-acetyltransferase
MILYTERLILRPWEEKDAESLYNEYKNTGEWGTPVLPVVFFGLLCSVFGRWIV